MISILAELVLDDGSPIKDQIEQFLSVHVFPEFKSPHAFLRARVCVSFHPLIFLFPLAAIFADKFFSNEIGMRSRLVL